MATITQEGECLLRDEEFPPIVTREGTNDVYFFDCVPVAELRGRLGMDGGVRRSDLTIREMFQYIRRLRGVEGITAEEIAGFGIGEVPELKLVLVGEQDAR